MHHITEPRHRRRVDGDAMLIRPPELVSHDGDILLFAVNIAEGHADKLDLLLDNVLLNLFPRILHLRLPSAASVGDIHLLIGVAPLGGHHRERPGHQRLRIVAEQLRKPLDQRPDLAQILLRRRMLGRLLWELDGRYVAAQHHLAPVHTGAGKVPDNGRPSV